MLITTSRKPSPRTRSFARNLERIFNSKYVNRGKMSMRDVFIKSRELGYRNSTVISEIKGNPSRIEVFDLEGAPVLSVDITVSNPLGSGRIQKKDLNLRWDLGESEFKKIIKAVLDVPEENGLITKINQDKLKKTTREEFKSYTDFNLIHVRPGKSGKAVVEVHDHKGQITGPRIHIHKCRTGGFDAS
jgi:U3 small nucleolar ribonucleoprotein protein IMP4